MSAFLRLVRRLSVIPVIAACIALFILMVMTFCDVILRSTFNAPIEAATELTRMLVAIMVFAVMPHISVTQGHIAVDLTDGLFHRFRLEKIRDGLVYIASAVMLIWPVERVYILAERARDYGDVTEYLNIPQFYIMWFIAISSGVSAVAMLIVGGLTLFAPNLLKEAAR